MFVLTFLPIQVLPTFFFANLRSCLFSYCFRQTPDMMDHEKEGRIQFLGDSLGKAGAKLVRSPTPYPKELRARHMRMLHSRQQGGGVTVSEGARGGQIGEAVTTQPLRTTTTLLQPPGVEGSGPSLTSTGIFQQQAEADSVAATNPQRSLQQRQQQQQSQILNLTTPNITNNPSTHVTSAAGRWVPGRFWQEKGSENHI